VLALRMMRPAGATAPVQAAGCIERIVEQGHGCLAAW
jgi:hypothetical protein